MTLVINLKKHSGGPWIINSGWSEHTDRNVLFRTTPTHLEIIITLCYRKPYYIFFFTMQSFKSYFVDILPNKTPSAESHWCRLRNSVWIKLRNKSLPLAVWHWPRCGNPSCEIINWISTGKGHSASIKYLKKNSLHCTSCEIKCTVINWVVSSIDPKSQPIGDILRRQQKQLPLCSLSLPWCPLNWSTKAWVLTHRSSYQNYSR